MHSSYNPSTDLAPLHGSLFMVFFRVFTVIAFQISNFFGLSITEEIYKLSKCASQLMDQNLYGMNFACIFLSLFTFKIWFLFR
jgi:hypothetical protein